ncbi:MULTISPECIES: LysE family translocator [Comamonas]|uniref:LysE family translocator n=1 Tax=Comamonas TaxID=283 RepID=UPI00237E1D05|nr:LysE family transporter [Comamonas aquatica]MDE1554929.1 LysE family transporter [Comamonas aquatica]
MRRYLLWLAWKLARAPADHPGPATGHHAPALWPSFVQGVAIQTLNPKAWLFALSAVGVFALPASASGPGALLALCAISLLACLVGVGCWAVLGRVLTQWLRTPQRQQWLHRALAALLVVSVLGMLA